MKDQEIRDIARLYVRHKKQIIALLRDYNVDLGKSPTHGQVIGAMYDLMNNDEGFVRDMHDLMVINGIADYGDHNTFADGYYNALGDIIGNIASAVGDVASSAINYKTEQNAADAQEEAALQQYILNEQEKSNGKTVLWISLGSLAVVGLGAFLILRKK